MKCEDARLSVVEPPPTPHVVTPERAEEGNRLLKEASEALHRARTLSTAIEILDTQREAAYARHRSAQRGAATVLTGSPGCGY